MSKLIDLTGRRFGRLQVIERDPIDTRSGRWVCKCDCGKICSIKGVNLRKGKIVSCGCQKTERIANLNRTHGLSKSRLYVIWNHMRLRCENPLSTDYQLYGDRGIKVCDEWQQFEPFRDWAFANGYRDNLTIDRIDVNGNYEPTNCRWATQKNQQNNRRNNRHITHNGKTLTLAQWAELSGLSTSTLWARLQRGWEFDRAIAEPIHTKTRNKRKGKK